MNDEWCDKDQWVANRILRKSVTMSLDTVLTVTVTGAYKKNRVRPIKFSAAVTCGRGRVTLARSRSCSSVLEALAKIDSWGRTLEIAEATAVRAAFVRPLHAQCVWRRDDDGEFKPFATDLCPEGWSSCIKEAPSGQYRAVQRSFRSANQPVFEKWEYERTGGGYTGKAGNGVLMDWNPETWFPAPLIDRWIPGSPVRLSKEFKQRYFNNADMREHIDEFGDCVGFVEGPMFKGVTEDVDVRWLPSGLRYGYKANDLEYA